MIPAIHIRVGSIPSTSRTGLVAPSRHATKRLRISRPYLSSGSRPYKNGTAPCALPARTFNPSEYLKYGGAIGLQVSLMSGSLYLLNQVNAAVPTITSISLESADFPKILVTAFFLVISIKSRLFCPLDASRPNLSTENQAISERKRPSWMPPPLTFPIVWTTIGLLRCASSVMVWEASGRDLLAAPIIIMCLHLAIGDSWNHVNVKQQELGMAVPGVILGCLGSGIFVSSSYYMTDPLAGLLLCPMVLWLTVASALVTDIWRLNVDPETGHRMPLIPVK